MISSLEPSSVARRIAQERDAFLVGPVVQHLHEDIHIGHEQWIDEKVTGRGSHSLMTVSKLSITSGRSTRTP
jgi:hypothetical protein